MEETLGFPSSHLLSLVELSICPKSTPLSRFVAEKGLTVDGEPPGVILMTGEGPTSVDFP